MSAQSTRYPTDMLFPTILQYFLTFRSIVDKALSQITALSALSASTQIVSALTWMLCLFWFVDKSSLLQINAVVVNFVQLL